MISDHILIKRTSILLTIKRRLEVKKKGKNFEVVTDKAKYLARSVIFCLGSERRKLNVYGEEEFAGKGITYCFHCDAPFFKDKDIAIIGGGDSAVVAAIYMSNYAKKIYMVDIEEKPRAKEFRLEKIKKNKK